MNKNDLNKSATTINDELETEVWHIPSIEEMKEDGTWDELSDGNKRVLEEATAFARSEEGKKYFEFLMSGIKNNENQQRYPWRT